MELNFLFFPSLKPTYTRLDLEGHIIYIPILEETKLDQNELQSTIPSNPHGPQYFINKYKKYEYKQKQGAKKDKSFSISSLTQSANFICKNKYNSSNFQSINEIQSAKTIQINQNIQKQEKQSLNQEQQQQQQYEEEFIKNYQKDKINYYDFASKSLKNKKQSQNNINISSLLNESLNNYNNFSLNNNYNNNNYSQQFIFNINNNKNNNYNNINENTNNNSNNSIKNINNTTSNEQQSTNDDYQKESVDISQNNSDVEDKKINNDQNIQINENTDLNDEENEINCIQPIDHLRIQNSDKNTNDKFYKVVDHIPCLFLRYPNCQQVIVYFHANGEDIGSSKEMLQDIHKSLKINVFSMEYPNYGIYKNKQKLCNTEMITRNSEIVYEYLVKEYQFQESDIFIMGRSIGSGPAVHIASQYKPGCLILVSALSSISQAVKDIAGWPASLLVKQRFDNANTIKKVKCPSLFIHGLKDTLISHTHSQQLFNNCNTVKDKRFSQEMTHNELSFIDDVIKPILKFLRNQKLIQNYYILKDYYPPQQKVKQYVQPLEINELVQKSHTFYGQQEQYHFQKIVLNKQPQKQ